MVLQQSCPRCPCDEHGIELQHCISCSGVVVPPQSTAYAARASPSTATRTDLAKRTLTKLGAILVKVKLFGSREHGVILRGWRSFKALETSWVPSIRPKATPDSSLLSPCGNISQWVPLPSPWKAKRKGCHPPTRWQLNLVKRYVRIMTTANIIERISGRFPFLWQEGTADANSKV